MDITKGKQELNTLCEGKDWFHDVGTDRYGRLVVYVKYCSEDILRFVPDTAGGVQVLVHTAASKMVKHEITSAAKTTLTQKLPLPIELPSVEEIVDSEEVEEQSLRHLQDELDKLEKICGTNTLSEIFFEIQDGKNAVTNMSARFLDVRKAMDKLYDTYGFDVLYEQLEL